MKVMVSQINVSGSKKDNLCKVLRVLSENCGLCDLVIFPEMTMGAKTSEVSLENLAEDVESGEFSKSVSETCAKYSVGACVCLWEKNPKGKVYNTAVVYDKSGRIIAKYRK